MTSAWRRPGLLGRLLYAVAATLLGGTVSVFARLELARRRGRTDVVERLPRGRVIVVANHTSFADGILLALACRRLGRSPRMLATAGVFDAPVLGGLLRRIGFIPVRRETSSARDSLDAAAAALEAGEAVALFPEGRITRDPDHWPERSKTGAVRLALRTGAPIVPVAIAGAHRLVSRRGHLLRLARAFVLTPRVEVAVGVPIDVRALTGGREDEAAVRAAADAVMGRLIDLLEDLRGQVAAHEHGVPRADDR
jgi:1-acyl-sn-glycerol-3-phosphate acyltransferase